MKPEQELEIEVRRLEDEVAKLRKALAKIYGIASLGVVHTMRAPGRGRPSGTTRFDERVFVKDLFDTYQQLPEDQRSREEVAKALGISRRTLHRYCERWDILWPPVGVETLEEVLTRLAAQNTALEAQRRASKYVDHQGESDGNRRLSRV